MKSGYHRPLTPLIESLFNVLISQLMGIYFKTLWTSGSIGPLPGVSGRLAFSNYYHKVWKTPRLA
jgi:hypothetical protein